jgi:hypothetical protein
LPAEVHDEGGEVPPLAQVAHDHRARALLDVLGQRVEVRELRRGGCRDKQRRLAGGVVPQPDGGKGRPRARRMLTDQDPTQKQLGDLFNIDQYAPTR